MKRQNRGVIFKTNKDDYAVAYYTEQLPKFHEEKRLLCHIFIDEKLKEPKYDIPMLKSITNLSMIGLI